MSSMRSASSSTRCSRETQVGVRTAHVVQEPARAGDDHVHALSKRAFLAAHPYSAVHGGAGQPGADRQLPEVLRDLGGELAGGREHQRPCGAALESRSLFMMGRRNAAVLPLPVSALARTSLPASAAGIAAI